MRRIGDPFGATCHYCPAPATTRDHIVPLAWGGPNAADNIVPSCEPCNQHKGSSRTTCECEQCINALDIWWPPEAEHLTQRISIPGYGEEGT
jgi:5-methylcytosine-specific restriction endonuclease McrA